MECEAFTELKESSVVEIRSGCIAIRTRGGKKDGNGIEAHGVSLSFCPYCGKRIIAKYSNEKGHWDWWHE